MKDRDKRAREKALRSRTFMREAHQDLEESKSSVRELLRLRQELFNGTQVDNATLMIQKAKALEAINHLFIDELGSRE